MVAGKEHNPPKSESLRLLAICENPLEVQAIVPVAQELERQSDPRIRVDFASQDALLCQGADEAIREAGREKRELPYPVRLTQSLLELNVWGKLKVILKTDYGLRGVMEEYDGLLCGIDDLVARMLIADARRYAKPTFQIFVSLNLGNAAHRSWMRRLKDGLRNVVGYLTGVQFLTYPNWPGGSHCDRLFVMGERNKERFVEEGVPSERVFTYGIPRFASLFENGSAVDSRPDWSRILYITGSFAWHDDMDGHRLQQRQLRQIVQALQCRPASERPELVVKAHPREEVVYYNWMREYDFVDVVPPETDLYECIRESTVVASICSTVAYEAVFLNRISILTRFPQPVPTNLPLGEMHEDFVEVQSAEEFLRTVDTLNNQRGMYDREISKQRRNAEKIIDPDTPQSAELIASNVRRYLSDTRSVS